MSSTSNSLRLKRGITKKFKRLGFSLKKDALNKLVELHEQCNNDGEFDELLDELGELTISQKLSTPIISLTEIQPAIDQMVQHHHHHNDEVNEAESSMLNVVSMHEENLLSLENAFDCKRFKYKNVGKQFVSVANGPIHGSARNLSAIFMDRYEMLLQRTLRHSIFRKSVLQSNERQRDGHHDDDDDDEEQQEAKEKEKESGYHLTNTAELIGTKSKKCVFGMLCELSEGKIYLQDTSGAIHIDVSNIKELTSGLFTFNCFVLCEGFMNNYTNVFEVEIIGFPPYEPRKKTLKTFNNLNFLPFEKQQIMLELEHKSQDDTFIFMSNIYLDESDTFEKLSKLFDGYSTLDIPPTLFIFMGNFTKKKLGSNAKDMKFLASLFDKLCDLLINKYASSLCKTSDFILIPGPNEQLIGNVLPQPQLLPSLCQKFNYYASTKQIAVHFQSNPFRIRFGTQEIVCFRHDLLRQMRRNCVIAPDIQMSKELSNHLVKTILDQSYLCPLPIEICPVYWNYAHSLYLYPSPHLIVLADTNDDYMWKYQDCNVVCPGNFSANGSFIAYTPYNKYVDFSKVQ